MAEFRRDTHPASGAYSSRRAALDSITGDWLIAAGWVLRVLAWAFAALFIAGCTSAVRKT